MGLKATSTLLPHGSPKDTKIPPKEEKKKLYIEHFSFFIVVFLFDTDLLHIQKVKASQQALLFHFHLPKLDGHPGAQNYEA